MQTSAKSQVGRMEVRAWSLPSARARAEAVAVVEEAISVPTNTRLRCILANPTVRLFLRSLPPRPALRGARSPAEGCEEVVTWTTRVNRGRPDRFVITRSSSALLCTRVQTLRVVPEGHMTGRPALVRRGLILSPLQSRTEASTSMPLTRRAPAIEDRARSPRASPPPRTPPSRA